MGSLNVESMMASCEKCGREIKNYGVFLGGVRCANNCSADMDEQQEQLDENTEVKELLTRLLDAKRMITAMVMANGGQFVLTAKDYEMAKVHTESLKLFCDEVNQQLTYTVEMKHG